MLQYIVKNSHQTMLMLLSVHVVIFQGSYRFRKIVWYVILNSRAININSKILILHINFRNFVHVDWLLKSLSQNQRILEDNKDYLIYVVIYRLLDNLPLKNMNQELE